MTQGKVLLSRDKPLAEMGMRELVLWVRSVADLWDWEYTSIGTHIAKVGEELRWACLELTKALEPPK